MARIFISFYNAFEDKAKLPLFYEGFIKGLEQAGNTLMVCSCPLLFPTAPPCPGRLKAQLKVFAPDLAILFNNNFYQYDFERELGIPVFIYSADSALLYTNRDAIRDNIGKYRFISGEGSDIKKYLGCQDSQILNVHFFTAIRAEERAIESNISFIGSYFPYGSIVHDFAATNPGAEERRKFGEYEKLVAANPYISFEELCRADNVPNFCKEQNRLHETVFYLSSKNRVDVLNAVADEGLRLYGSPAWLALLDYYPRLAMAFNYEQVYSLKHNQDIYNSSKIGINIPHIQAMDSFPWRVTDVMASNALLISARMKGFEKVMPEVYIPQFESAAEARELCKKYIEDEEARKELVASHQEVIERRFRFRHFIEAFESFSGLNISPAAGAGAGTPPAPTEYVAIAADTVKRKEKSLWSLVFALLRCCFYSESSKKYKKRLSRVHTVLTERLLAMRLRG